MIVPPPGIEPPLSSTARIGDEEKLAEEAEASQERQYELEVTKRSS